MKFHLLGFTVKATKFLDKRKFNLFILCMYAFLFRAYSGKYVSWNEEGIFTCIVCGNKLFTSDAKFHSGCGWPSFTDVIEKGNVTFKEDFSYGK